MQTKQKHHDCLAAVMTGGEVAAEFGVDGSTVRRACANGWIPARKADGRTWLIRRSDAERRWGRHPITAVRVVFSALDFADQVTVEPADVYAQRLLGGALRYELVARLAREYPDAQIDVDYTLRASGPDDVAVYYADPETGQTLSYDAGDLPVLDVMALIDAARDELAEQLIAEGYPGEGSDA